MKRWYLYALIGLIFGIFDWFYLDWLARGLSPNLGENPFIVIPIILGLNYGIWLVPIIPVTLYEANRAKTIKSPIFAGILTWSCAILSYYIFYAFLLSLGRLPNLEHLNIFGQNFENVRPEYWRMFNRIILFQFLEWTPIAVIGGGVAGAIAWWVIRRFKHPKSKFTN
ncbi:MAG: hypothetical protein RQ728_00335 [Brevefilum sp.]|nr:hypothetical protein [Brevefilum sp.]MDT8380684.1 hypothetical protein [Brevefilum sp.]MDW7753567.1 hypothetical protein [Brevefilum sp.]